MGKFIFLRLAAFAALIFALALVLSTCAVATVHQVLVFQMPSGGNYQLYVGDDPAHEKVALEGTVKMSNIVLGDVDGDGAEDEMVYSDPIAGTLGYYKIPGDGDWHAERDHTIPGTPSDAVPMAVVRTSATGAPGIIVFRSSSFGGAFAVNPDGSNLTTIGAVDMAYAVDARLQGFKGDLFYANLDGTYWREGVSGPDHSGAGMDWLPLGGGKVIGNQPERTMCFFSYGVGKIAMCDKDWNFTPIAGTDINWLAIYGNNLVLGDINADSFDEILFVNSPGYPLQWYKVPDDGGPWNSNGGYFCDQNTWFGWKLRGVAKVDIGIVPVPVSCLSEIRKLAVGSTIYLSSYKAVTMPVRELDTAGQPVITGFYLEELDRSAGVRVESATYPGSGNYAVVSGKLVERNGEKVIAATGLQTKALLDKNVYAINIDGTGLTESIGEFDSVIGADVRGLGRKADLVYKKADGPMFWSEGVGGTEHATGGQFNNWYPRAAGNAVPGYPDYRIAFQSLGAGGTGILYIYDKTKSSWSTYPIEAINISGTNSSWGLPFTFSDIDGDGLDEIVFYNVALQYYKIPAPDMAATLQPTSPWDQSRYTLEADTMNIWTRHIGVATLPGIGKVVVGKQAASRGDNLEMFSVTTKQLIPLEGTRGITVSYGELNNPIIADVDGDGFEDEIVFQNSTGDMAYYKIPVNGSYHAENLHQIAAVGNPQGVVTAQGVPAKVVFYKRSSIKSLGANIQTISGSGLPMDGLMVRIAGMIGQFDATASYVTISDGSTQPIKVYCPELASATQTTGFVIVTGCVGAEKGTDDKIVPVIRTPSLGDITFVAM